MAIEAARQSARRYVNEAKAQAKLITGEHRDEARRIVAQADREEHSVSRAIDGARARLEEIASRLTAQLPSSHRDVLAVRQAAAAVLEEAVGARRYAEPGLHPRRELALGIVASVAYWTLVVAVSLVLVAVLILFLESRDPSSVGE